MLNLTNYCRKLTRIPRSVSLGLDMESTTSSIRETLSCKDVNVLYNRFTVVSSDISSEHKQRYHDTF